MALLTSRRSFLYGLTALVAAPAVIRVSTLMPINSAHLQKLKYVIANGPDAGTIVELSGSPFKGFIPCDGRLVRSFEYPELCRATRGREPIDDYDDVLHIDFDDCYGGHEPNIVTTVEHFTSYNMEIPT